MGVNELKAANAELRQKVKRYYHLISEQKAANDKAAAEANVQEDLNEFSITRKLGHTDMGDISDTLEFGSAVNKSIENDNYISRANIEE